MVLHVKYMKEAIIPQRVMCQLNLAPINGSSLNRMSENLIFLFFAFVIHLNIDCYIFFHKYQCRPILEYGFRNRAQSATITILPEIVLPHPIYGSYDSNSSSRFRGFEESELKLQNYQSKSLYWPQFVYKIYDVVEASKKIREFLLTLKIG